MAWWNIYLSIIYRTLSIDIQKLDKRILRNVLGPGSWRLLTNYSYDVTNLLVSIFTIVGFVPVLVWPGHCWQRADTSYGGLLIMLITLHYSWWKVLTTAFWCLYSLTASIILSQVSKCLLCPSSRVPAGLHISWLGQSISQEIVLSNFQ